MRILDRYVANAVLMATLVVILVVVGLDMVFTLVDELDQLKGGYGFVEALQFMGLRLPRRVYEYLPLACLIGCIAGLGALAASSELTVMRAAGASVGRIGLAVMKPMLVLMALNMVLAEFVVPDLERIAQSHKAVALGKGDMMSNKGKGYWHREGNTFMRFTAVEPNGVLHGITLFDFNEQQDLERIRYAERALFQGSYWQMEQLVDMRISTEQIERAEQVTAQWNTGLTPESLSVVLVQPRDMSISNLFSYTRYLDVQGLNPDSYLLSFWRKVTQPLSTLALVVLGISFIFGPLRSVTPGYRIFSGILAGLIYKYTEELLAPASIVIGFDPLWASLIPIGVCLGIGGVLLKRAG